MTEHHENGGRIACFCYFTGVNRMVVSAHGREQTLIIHQFCKRVAEFEGLNIAGMSTSRIGGNIAGSHMALVDVYGDAGRLTQFAGSIQEDPWLTPNGGHVVPEAIGNFDLIAPDRTRILYDATGIISVKYGINIESMYNATFTGSQAALAVMRHRDAGNQNSLHELRRLTGALSFTRMKLEVPRGVSMATVKADILTLGEGFQPFWTPIHRQPPAHTPPTDG